MVAAHLMLTHKEIKGLQFVKQIANKARRIFLRLTDIFEVTLNALALLCIVVVCVLQQ